MTASATFRVHLLAHSSQICSPFFSNLRKFLEKHEDGDLAVSHPFQNTAYNRSFFITLMLIKGASTVIKCESVRFASERSRVRIPPGPPNKKNPNLFLYGNRFGFFFVRVYAPDGVFRALTPKCPRPGSRDASVGAGACRGQASAGEGCGV